MIYYQEWGHGAAYYPCRTWPHQVLNGTFCYQSLAVLNHIRFWIESFVIRVVEEVLLPISLTLLGDPIQSIPWLWNQPIQVGKHHGLSLVTKTRCPLWPQSALCLQLLLVTTVVTFTLTRTTAVVCFRWVMISGSIVLYMVLHNLHSACYYGGGGNHSWIYPSSQLLLQWFYFIVGF